MTDVPTSGSEFLPDPKTSEELILPVEKTSVEPMEVIEFSGTMSPPTDPRELSPPELINTDAPPSWFWGVFEAMAWWWGTLLVHVVAGATLAIGFIVYNVIQKKPNPVDIQDSPTMLYITAGEMIVFVLATILAVSLRFWGRTFQELNFSRPDSRHLWMVIGGTLPLTLCVSVWGVPVQQAWDLLKQAMPVLALFDNLNSVEAVAELAESTSFLSMVFVVAILPAIGEELIFRGAIGRTLIANLGLVRGVLFTSFLFGWIHIHPVHAVAVIPLGLAMHLVYLWSRSFWLPMLLHFLNNCWATVAAQSHSVDPTRHGMQLTIWDGLLLVASAIGVIVLTIGFWQSRVRLFGTDGREWDTGRFPVRVPPSPDIRSRSFPIDSVYWRVGVFCMVFVHAVVIFELFT